MREYLSRRNLGGVFDPETIDLLAAALDLAVQSLKRSGAPVAAEAYQAAAREQLAAYIIEAAEEGERDARKLADDATVKLAFTSLRGLRGAARPAP